MGLQVGRSRGDWDVLLPLNNVVLEPHNFLNQELLEFHAVNYSYVTVNCAKPVTS